MSLEFVEGDDLVFQVESGFGIMRVISVEGSGEGTVWHIRVYEDFYPDVESAEGALASSSRLDVRLSQVALTEHAFGKTPAARIGNRPVTDEERATVNAWGMCGGIVHDRSIMLMIGMR